MRRHQDHLAIRTDVAESVQEESITPEVFAPSEPPVTAERQLSSTPEPVCRPVRSRRVPEHLKDYELS